MNGRPLTVRETLIQSQCCHEDWSTEEHIQYLEGELFILPNGNWGSWREALDPSFGSPVQWVADTLRSASFKEDVSLELNRTE